MSYKKIPKLPQLSWCLLYTMIWYHCSPLVSCRFLRCKASVPTLHPLCPPAPWALDLHPWWCHHCHLCPMGWQLQPQRPWNPKQGNNTVVWGGCEVWDLGWFWEAKVGVTEMEWNLCFWSFFINMLGWTFCEIEDMDNGGEEATFQMVHQMRGGFQDWLFVLYASRFDKSVLPQGSTTPKHLSLIQKGSPIHYLQRLDQTQTSPWCFCTIYIYIYLTGWNKARCKIIRAFLVTLASASGISRSQVRGLCLPSTGGCILSSTDADDTDGAESRDTDAGGESIATQPKWGQEILRLWDVISLEKNWRIFLHAFSFAWFH